MLQIQRFPSRKLMKFDLLSTTQPAPSWFGPLVKYLREEYLRDGGDPMTTNKYLEKQGISVNFSTVEIKEELVIFALLKFESVQNS